MAFAAAQSQSSNVVLYVAVGLYVALLTVIAKLAHRRKQKEAAVVGQIKAHFSGSYGTCTLMLTTFSTIYSGYTVTGIPDEAFARGFVSVRWIGATLVIVAGMLLLYPRLRRLAVERSYTSPLDFIADRFGTLRLRVLCAICGVIPMVLYIAAQMLAFAAMVEGMTLQVLPKEASMLLFCAMILTLEMLGGMNSVVFTDVVQCSVMIVAFLMTPFVLGAEYGFLPEIAPADCGSLMRVAPNATDAHAAPEACWGPGCVPAGCIAAVRPEFYKFPSRSTLCDTIFFLMNMLAAPMTPHMLQRAYIAKTDFDLRFVIGAMLVAPFIAQPPGIVIGLVKAAYDPAWPRVDQEATAFSGVMAQLKLAGPLQYAFVLVTTCCALAAIMSTADSALMGVSSVISNDFLKGILCPSLSTQNVVRAGTLASVCTCMVAFLLGTFLSSDELGAINSFNGGMLMQMLPAFGMGLYTQVSERTVTLGMGLGLSSLLLVVTLGNPLEGYVPAISLAALINFLTVALAHPLAQLLAPGAEAQAEEEAEGPKKAKTKLEVAEIRKVMASSREPKLGFVALMLALALGSSPWYGSPNEQEIMILGFPRWALAQLGAFLVVFGVGLLAVGLWRPPPPPQVAKGEEAEDRESALGSGQEEGALQGVAPEAPAKC